MNEVGTVEAQESERFKMQAPAWNDFKTEQDRGVLIITIERGERRNALTWEAWAELEAILHEYRDVDDVRVAVITGSNGVFSGGTDLRGAGRQVVSRAQSIRQRYAPILSVIDWPKPIVAAVNGTAAGAGLSLALACDVRIVGEDASFFAAWAKRGLAPDMGASALLPILVGPSRAFDILANGRRVNAVDAERYGLVLEIVRNDQVLSRAREYAHELAVGPSIAIEMTKRLLQQRWRAGLELQLALEESSQEVCRNSADAVEGRASFLERRDGHFIGR